MVNYNGELLAADEVNPKRDKTPTQRQVAREQAKTNQNVSKTGNLSYSLRLKMGLRYDISANINPSDGIVNGTECIVRHISHTTYDGLPVCIWVEFLEPDIGKERRRAVRSSHERYTS